MSPLAQFEEACAQNREELSRPDPLDVSVHLLLLILAVGLTVFGMSMAFAAAL